jgi:hypothetical protein
MGVPLWTAWGEEWALQEKVTFNGTTKQINVNSDITNLDIRDDVYSAWVRWLEREENERYEFAMRFTGLDPIPGGFTGDTYFLINGWKLVYDPRVVAISGILYSDDYPTPYYFTDGSPVYPATVSALGIKSNVTLDYDLLAAAVAAQFAEPSMTTSGIASATASAIGTVDVDPVGIADEVESRFTFGDDGRVAADINGSESMRDIKRSVVSAIPSIPSAQTIWDAAPKHLKKAAKTKDYSDAIRALSNKIDSVYAAIDPAKRSNMPTFDMEPLLAAINSVDTSDRMDEILGRIASISMPDTRSDMEALTGQLDAVREEIESITASISEVRDDIVNIPAPDLSQIATKKELSAIQSLIAKLDNYDDAQIKQMLESIIVNTEALPDESERINRKVDLLLDNQMRLF